MSLVSWPSRKNLLADIFFITSYWQPDQVPDPHIVYISKQLPVHLPLLAELFPSFRFTLFSPLPKNTRQQIVYPASVTYHPREIGYDDLEELRGTVTYLITLDTKGEYTKPQVAWLRELQPKEASLTWFGSKFYLVGIEVLLPWLPEGSRECRLIPERNADGEYFEEEYSEDVFARRAIELVAKRKEPVNGNNPITNDSELLAEELDSSIERTILHNYYSITDQQDDLELIIGLSRRITIALRTPDNYNLAFSRRGANTPIQRLALALQQRDWPEIRKSLSEKLEIDDTLFRWRFDAFYYGERLHNDSGLLFRSAVASGSIGVVKVLLGEESIDPGAMDNIALQDAALSGKTAIVELLASAKTVLAPTFYNTAPRPWSIYELWRGGYDIFDEQYHSVLDGISLRLAKDTNFQEHYRAGHHDQPVRDTPFHQALYMVARYSNVYKRLLMEALPYRERLAVSF